MAKLKMIDKEWVQARLSSTAAIHKVTHHYRGFEITVEREGPTLFWSIFRESDGWEMESSFAETTEEVLTMVNVLSRHVDDYWEHPEEYEE